MGTPRRHHAQAAAVFSSVSERGGGAVEVERSGELFRAVPDARLCVGLASFSRSMSGNLELFPQCVLKPLRLRLTPRAHKVIYMHDNSKFSLRIVINTGGRVTQLEP